MVGQMDNGGKESKPIPIRGVAVAGEGDGSAEDAILDLLFFRNCAWRGVVQHLEEVIPPRVLTIVGELGEQRGLRF